jgi:hypothetical protein
MVYGVLVYSLIPLDREGRGQLVTVDRHFRIPKPSSLSSPWVRLSEQLKACKGRGLGYWIQRVDHRRVGKGPGVDEDETWRPSPADGSSPRTGEPGPRSCSRWRRC